MLSCLSRVAKVATRLRHLVFNLWWAERPVVFLTCVPQCWQVIVLFLLESLFIDCLSISDLHLSWSEVCLEISLLFWRFLALSRIMRRYLSKKLWLWASVLAIFALYKLLNEVERGFVWRLAVNGCLGSWSILQSMFMQVLSITFSNGSKLYLVEASVSFIPIIFSIFLW